MPPPASTLSIILVSYNERARLSHVLELLATEFPEPPEVIVVDNASSDGSSQAVQAEFPWVRVESLPQNIMYGKGNNAGLAVATGELLMILNPDVDWAPGALRGLVDDLRQQPAIDLAAPQLRYPDGRVQVSAHRRFPNLATVFIDYCLPLQQLCLHLGYHPHLLSPAAHTTTRSIAHATGVCLLLRRRVLTDLGGFDPEFTMYLEETDWQKRMADAGFSRWLIGRHTITHFGSAQKTFAQASPHFLWGLHRYADKHWTPPTRLWLVPVLWLATAISLITLGIAWPFSLVNQRVRRRVAHYVSQYGQLAGRLLRYPRRPPIT